MNSEHERLELIRRHMDGTASAEDLRALQEGLRSDPNFRRTFARYANVDAALGSGRLTLAPVAEIKTIVSRQASFTWLSWGPLTAAAAAMLVLLGALWFGAERTKAAAPFAMLMATTNARWADPNVELALNSGEMLSGSLRLEAGRAEFRMLDGATVVLEGAVSVRFAERKVVFVDEGRIFCHCPTPESRLSVITPQTKVVDLGTEFTVEARADESTRVSVLSGKVDVKSPNAGVLTAGEAVDVRKDVVVRLKPLSPEEMQALLPESLPTMATHGDSGQNKLFDPGFENPAPSALWRGTDESLKSAIASGRTGNAVRIRAEGKNYPIVKQRVETGEVSGRIVQASAWAMSPPNDPMSERQFAVIKITFLNADGREFACSSRHFLHGGVPAHEYVYVHLAALAPPGTHSVELQLILAAGGQKAGSVCFDDAALTIAADAAK
ncbi:hypothetical protein BH11VER1_BH11VER1_20340 [soil metagenome]